MPELESRVGSLEHEVKDLKRSVDSNHNWLKEKFNTLEAHYSTKAETEKRFADGMAFKVTVIFSLVAIFIATLGASYGLYDKISSQVNKIEYKIEKLSTTSLSK